MKLRDFTNEIRSWYQTVEYYPEVFDTREKKADYIKEQICKLVQEFNPYANAFVEKTCIDYDSGWYENTVIIEGKAPRYYTNGAVYISRYQALNHNVLSRIIYPWQISKNDESSVKNIVLDSADIKEIINGSLTLVLPDKIINKDADLIIKSHLNCYNGNGKHEITVSERNTIENAILKIIHNRDDNTGCCGMTKYDIYREFVDNCDVVPDKVKNIETKQKDHDER